MRLQRSLFKLTRNIAKNRVETAKTTDSLALAINQTTNRIEHQFYLIKKVFKFILRVVLYDRKDNILRLMEGDKEILDYIESPQ